MNTGSTNVQSRTSWPATIKAGITSFPSCRMCRTVSPTCLPKLWSALPGTSASRKTTSLEWHLLRPVSFPPPGETPCESLPGDGVPCAGKRAHPRVGRPQARIASGETTEDGNFSLERVACFGSCALARWLWWMKESMGG